MKHSKKIYKKRIGSLENWKQRLSHYERIFKRKICRIAQKFWMTLLAVKNIILTSPDLDTIRKKRGQSQKQQSKKQIQKVMQKQ